MANDNYAKKDLKNVNDGKVTSDKSSHPVGTVLGAVGGAAAGVAGSIIAGAAAGAAVGPVGAAVGAAVGAVVGAGTGHEIAAQVNPKAEDLYWRENYHTRPYITEGSEYEVYKPAYDLGVRSYSKYKGKKFEDVESNLSDDWEGVRGDSELEWNDAKPAAQDAFNRLNGIK